MLGAGGQCPARKWNSADDLQVLCDPYGNPAGTIPGSWPDGHGYLGQPADPATTLDLLGARQYDPVTGRFLSLDPLFQPGSPLTMGGYAYAANNPATSSDPSGLCITNGDTCQKDPNTGSTGNGDPYGGGGVTDTCTPATPGCAGYTPPGTTLLPQGSGSRAAYDQFVTSRQDFLDPQATSSSPRYILDSTSRRASTRRNAGSGPRCR